MSRILADEPITRQRTLWHTDRQTGGAVVEHKQDVEDIVEEAKRLRLDSDGTFKGETFHRVGMIPTVIYEQMMRDGRAQDGKALLKWLDDPDNRAFKLTTASLSR